MPDIKIHHTAEVQTSNIGEGTFVWQHTVILAGAVIGNNCNINAHCFIENAARIGNNVTVKCGVYIWDGITVEDDVFIGPNVTLTNDKHPRSKKYPDDFPKTLIKKGASIGGGSVILPGLTIGEYAMVGAGSLVTKDVPPHTLVFGSPAEPKGFICSCGQKLAKTLICPDCGKNFILNGSIPEEIL